MQILIPTFLILSGIAALAYQLVWVRLLGYTVGGTSAAISTVLAAFFLGLALGNAWAPRLLRTFAPLRLYAALELIIGIVGLSSLFVLPNLGSWLAPALGSSLLAKFLAATLVLLVPTVCMGATFPVVALVATDSMGTATTRQLGATLGQLYSFNTLGAVLGAAATGFWWIPLWGLNGAVLVAAGLNLTVALLALATASSVARAENKPDHINMPSNSLPEIASAPAADASLRHAALAILAMTGLVSIATEVGWSKYLAIFAGGTVFGFAMILIVVLTGIAMGSWSMHRLLPRLERPERTLLVGLLLLSLSLLTCRTLLSYLPSVLEYSHGVAISGTTRLFFKFACVAVVLLPPTMLFGALFPLSLSLYCSNREGVRERLGPAYALNTACSVLGSLAAGFWVIPTWGTNVLLTSAGLLVLPFALLLLRPAQSLRMVALAACIVLVCGVLAWRAPGLRFEQLVASVKYVHDVTAPQDQQPEFLYLREGKAGVITLTTFDKRYVRLQNNGLNESLLDLQQPAVGPVAESLLGLVPALLHSRPRSSFVVGWGGGATVRALEQTDIESIRVVELEEAVVDAIATLLGDQSGLHDARLDLSIDDARFCLLTEDRNYDLIVSQPSHPWVAGAAAVFTEEFFRIGKSRLHSGGIFGQWVNLFNMDVSTLCLIQRTFYSVFPEGFTMMDLDNGDYLMFGSNKALSLEPEVLDPRWQRLQEATLARCCDVQDATDLLQYFALSRRQILEHCGTGPHNTDLNLKSETRLASLSYERLRQRRQSESPYAFLDEFATFQLGDSHDAAASLMTLGERAVARGNLPVARRVVRGLEKVAPSLADSLSRQMTSQVRVRQTSP